MSSFGETTKSSSSRPGGSPREASSLAARYREVRAFTESLCRPLATEDYVVQSMPDCSPAKWHLAHTTWFFETFILASLQPNFASSHPEYNFLFNSYYNAIGQRHARPLRGLLSRPTVAEVYQYRHDIDQAMSGFICSAGADALAQLAPLLELGLHHEQQHQELIVTDLKHMLSCNPLRPGYRSDIPDPVGTASKHAWISYPEGIRETGHDGIGFAFDNESPRHRVWQNPYGLGSRLVTCGEYREFIDDDGYSRPELWLSAGWDTVCRENWAAPLYWESSDATWTHFTLAGMKRIETDAPVQHISYFEADAYARWRAIGEPGVRLPTEFEWEAAATCLPVSGSFANAEKFYAAVDTSQSPDAKPNQMFGELWQWTASPYTAYPGYAPASGALGEYNGKFMCNQFVLRGGSCATSESHIRPTYRNFFAPDARWQYTGIRLAKDCDQ